MSHKALNPVNPQRPKRVAVVLSNPAVSTTTGWPVGFWWAELTHPYFHFTEVGYQVEVFSPDGGRCQADAMSNPEDASQWQAEDVISRGYLHDPEFLELVDNTARVDEIDVDTFDAIVVAGGQGPMFTFDTADQPARQVRRVLRCRQGDRGALPRRRHPSTMPASPTANRSSPARPSPGSPTSKRTSPTRPCGTRERCQRMCT